jgi:hypothetical protein
MEAATTDFLKIVSAQYKQHCDSQGKETNHEEFLEYLLNRNFITDKTIKRFVVVTAYPEALQNLGIKRTAIWEIEEKYSVSESTIKVYLKRFQQFFKLAR